MLRLILMVGTLFAIVLTATPKSTAATPPPNILFLLADDLGWADLGCYGSTFYETPNLDRLAREGVRFTFFYTAGSICSPTRSSLMTGKYPVRTGITDWIPGMKIPSRAHLAPEPTKRVLDPREFTLGRAFRDGGYETFYVGKWHLGPTAAGLAMYGFDHYMGAEGEEEGGDAPPAAARKAKRGGDDSAGKGQRNAGSQPIPRQETTDRFTEAAIAYLENRDSSKPFFLMLSYHDVHTPIHPAPETIAHYRAKQAALPESPPPIIEHNGRTRPRQDDAGYATRVAKLDDSLARLRVSLEKLGLSENTIVVFASDNGGLSTKGQPGPTSNLPLRAGKGWLYEGGIRAPLIVHVPHASNAGTTCGTPVISNDIYPTFLELAGLPARPAQHVDGISVAALVRGDAAPQRPTLYWHYPHYHGSTWRPGAAIRDRDWKAIEFYDPQGVELYNLRDDPDETRNLAFANPAKANELLGKLHAWQKASGAIMPAPNPAYKAKP